MKNKVFYLASVVTCLVITSFLVSFKTSRNEKVLRTCSDYQGVVWMVKAVEGLRLCPYEDGDQYSVGYGTSTTSTDCVTKNDASQLFVSRFQHHYDQVVSEFPDLNRRQALILAGAHYNLGSFGPRLKRAIRSGDMRRVCKALRRYVYFKGEVNAGLKERRDLECSFLLADDSSFDSLSLICRDIVVSDVSAFSNL